jgi:curved DNA-binding protein CbpA
MSASQRPGEITFYEELGVEDTASGDEIRDAFRSLARLLHPDAQTDPQLKDTAERQMRRLNRIYEVLSDPARRTRYDGDLNAPRSAPIIVLSGGEGNVKKLLERLATIGAVVVGLFLLIWFAVDSNNSAEVRGQEARAASASRSNENAEGDSGEQITQLRARIRTLETEKNSALAQLALANGTMQSAMPGASKLDGLEPDMAIDSSLSTAFPGTKPAARGSEDARTIPSAPVDSSGQVSPFVGVWTYAKGGGASPGGKAEYPPEFIEVAVTQEKGRLHGQYHSRYQVLDHAISPDVDFVFAGTPSGSSANCTWLGSGGAKGRLTLKILPAGAIQIVWNATELGTQQWLVNGTAALTRK